ncbi:MAG TPA: LuxR C-terminal-related transcriptional regulator [Bryobacteraceae bacterium]|jgi:PAS domain S-box-containing protein
MMLASDHVMAMGAGAEAVAVARIQEESGLEHFRQVAEVSVSMIWMADADGLCTFANQSWLNFCGRRAEQELGTGWADAIHPDDVLGALGGYWSAIRAGAPMRIEYRILARDGMYQRVERLGSPRFGLGGELRGYVGCVAPHLTRVDWEARRHLAQLSARELQVLELIAAGCSTKEIAERLGIRYKTADSHRTHLLKKLGIHDIATLVRFAIRSGAIQA